MEILKPLWNQFKIPVGNDVAETLIEFVLYH
jgi:hypothetical protein